MSKRAQLLKESDLLGADVAPRPVNRVASFFDQPDKPPSESAGPLLALLEQGVAALARMAEAIDRIADKLDPPPAKVVGTEYLAKQLNQSKTWIAEMSRNGTMPANCIVPGSGNGKPWKYYRERLDEWLESR